MKIMVEKIDMSLDDIIKSNKQVRRYVGRSSGGGRGSQGNRGQRRGGNPSNLKRSYEGVAVQKGRGRGGISRSYTRGDVRSARKFGGGPFGDRKISAARGAVNATMQPTKLMISNLDFGVSDSDIQELFAEFGPLKSAAVHYDRSRKSLGTAEVTFERRGDAIKAMKQYNGIPLDGRAMNIQLTTSEIPAVFRRPAGGGIVERRFKNSFPRGSKGQTHSNRGQQNRRRGAANRNQSHKQPTAEELDAELEAYLEEMK